MEKHHPVLDQLDEDIARALDEAIKRERNECAKIAQEWAEAFSSGREYQCEEAAWRIYEDIKSRDTSAISR
jgi:hypothetical protein